MKRTLTACILLLALCLSLTACGKADTDADEPVSSTPNGNSGVNLTTTVVEIDAEGTIYTKRTAIQENNSYFSSATRGTENIFVSGTDENGNAIVYALNQNTYMRVPSLNLPPTHQFLIFQPPVTVLYF